MCQQYKLHSANFLFALLIILSPLVLTAQIEINGWENPEILSTNKEKAHTTISLPSEKQSKLENIKS